MKYLIFAALILTTLTSTHATAHEIQFVDYDMHHSAPSFTMVNGKGTPVHEYSIVMGKAGLDWLVAPDNKRNGLWYRMQTRYIGSTSSCGVEDVQTSFRYTADSSWEIAGQRDIECSIGAVNTYADFDRKGIVIAPGAPYDSRSILSDFWHVPNPYHKQPAGYPFEKPTAQDTAYSYAEVVDRFDQLTLNIPGFGDHTYLDVVEVFWRHGNKDTKNRPCGKSTPGLFLVDGYRVYGFYRWYAKNVGLIKEKLIWYCDFDNRMHGVYAPDVDTDDYTYYKLP